MRHLFATSMFRKWHKNTLERFWKNNFSEIIFSFLLFTKLRNIFKTTLDFSKCKRKPWYLESNFVRLSWNLRVADIDHCINRNELILSKPSTNIVIEMKLTTCDTHVFTAIAIRDTWYALSDSSNRNSDLVTRGRNIVHGKYSSRSPSYKSFTFLRALVTKQIVESTRILLHG